MLEGKNKGREEHGNAFTPAILPTSVNKIQTISGHAICFPVFPTSLFHATSYHILIYIPSPLESHIICL